MCPTGVYNNALESLDGKVLDSSHIIVLKVDSTSQEDISCIIIKGNLIFIPNTLP
jgi:hypothetical protein